jgi:hypothetical protein
MNKLLQIFLVGIWLAACSTPASSQTGTLRGHVTIGPLGSTTPQVCPTKYRSLPMASLS